MDLDKDKNFSFSNLRNSCSSSFLLEKEKENFKNQKDINNSFSHCININDIQLQKNNENFEDLFMKENNNKINTENINKNQLIKADNMNNQENKIRFFNYFKTNENGYIDISYDKNNYNNHSIFNNNYVINNSTIKKENYNYNYLYENTSNNINLNNNYYNYGCNLKNRNNLNFTQNNFLYNNYVYNIKDLNNINNINDNNLENYNNINDKNNSNNNSLINKMYITNTNLNKNVHHQEFLDYVNNLNMPLIKFLCTKKGILEMENYLNNHKKSNIEILLYLLNREGLNKLMKHKFGNYFIQEIIKEANYRQIKLCLELISLNFVEISKNNSGTHVLQALLDKVNSFELRDIILKSIENKELEMAFNKNSTYVIQKIITIVPDNERLNMNEIIIKNCINLAMDSDCVFIVEKFISSITISENKKKIRDIICENFLQLANSPFGNYLIQYLFQIWKNDDIEKINDIILDNAIFLIKQRYSSNIIEKAIDIYDNSIKQKLIRNLCLGGDILDIIKNQYGHYVLNKAIKYIDEGLKFEIEKILNNQMPNMNKKEKTKSKKFINNLKKIGQNKKNFKRIKK